MGTAESAGKTTSENRFYLRAVEKYDDTKILRHGWPDFLIVEDGATFGVEVKSGLSDPLRENQQQMFKALGDMGVEVYVYNEDLAVEKLVHWSRYDDRLNRARSGCGWQPSEKTMEKIRDTRDEKAEQQAEYDRLSAREKSKRRKLLERKHRREVLAKIRERNRESRKEERASETQRLKEYEEVREHHQKLRLAEAARKCKAGRQRYRRKLHRKK